MSIDWNDPDLFAAATDLNAEEPACQRALRAGAAEALEVLRHPETVLNDEVLQSATQPILVRRANEDLALTRFRASRQASDDPCLTWGRWTVGRTVRRENAAYLLRQLSPDFVRSLQPDGGAVGAMDIILRHYDERDRLGTTLEQRALRIYSRLAERREIDPVSYGGFIDRIEIRNGGHQLFGTHVACVSGSYQYSPPIANPEMLDQRRRDIGWPPGPDPIGRTCRERPS